jgi:proline dehydrogenase
VTLFSKLVVSTTQARPVEKLITKTRPGKALARRFVAGDTLDEAVVVARSINDDGLKVSLDLLGEEVHDADSARRARDEYAESLHQIEDENLDSNIEKGCGNRGLGDGRHGRLQVHRGNRSPLRPGARRS